MEKVTVKQKVAIDQTKARTSQILGQDFMAFRTIFLTLFYAPDRSSIASDDIMEWLLEASYTDTYLRGHVASQTMS